MGLSEDNQACAVLAQFCVGLGLTLLTLLPAISFAHRGILHCDIKVGAREWGQCSIERGKGGFGMMGWVGRELARAA